MRGSGGTDIHTADSESSPGISHPRFSHHLLVFSINNITYFNLQSIREYSMMSTPFRSHKSKRTSRSHKKKPTDRGLPPLRIAMLGPTGQCGSCIVDELLYRGHDVVGVSRNPPDTWKENPSHRGVYESVSVDVQDEAMLRDVFSSGFDAIVCAFAPGNRDLGRVYEVGVEGHGRVKRALLGSSHSGSFIVIGMLTAYSGCWS